jgi:hypothetical protein
VAADATAAAPVAVPGVAREAMPYADRFGWSVVMITVGAIVVTAVAAPAAGAAPAVPLAWLLFLGSSVHVAATLALFSFSSVRTHARSHPARYLVAPMALLASAVAGCLLLPAATMSIVLLGVFAWQLWHYQKQNLGLASLAVVAAGLPSLSRVERRCVLASGVAGVLALLARPSVLQVVAWRPTASAASGARDAAALVLAASAAVAVGSVARRGLRMRPALAVYMIAVVFPTPLLLTSSPYTAIGGLTLAHGLQYLLLVGHVVVGPPSDRLPYAGATRSAIVAIVVTTAGLLAAASHLHNSGESIARVIFGAYLASLMAHFLVDAGLWRLRDPFPRRWLSQRLPQLLGSPTD